MQTPESVAAGDNAAGTDTYRIVDLSFDPADGMHEYRFDWLPNKVSFYADGAWIQDLEYTYPDMPGHLSLNHWNNGNADWSQGPPLENAVLTVAYVKAYFNSSDPDKIAQYAQQCQDGGSTAQTCQVANVAGPPIASDGYGKWFDRGMCGEQINSSKPSMTATITSTSKSPTATATTQATSASGTFEGGYGSPLHLACQSVVFGVINLLFGGDELWLWFI